MRINFVAQNKSFFLTKDTDITNQEILQVSKVQDFIALGKFRLASLVVFSAALGYLIALESISHFNWIQFSLLIIGGFLVTGASNAFNQVWERKLDAKMERTKNRPLAAERLTITEAIVFAVLIGVLGEICLFQLNFLSGVLGFLAMFLYVMVYTPLKTISPVAVFIGAFPGSIPPMLGYIAVTGQFGLIPGILFLTQFFWQFPHFWAIAWKIHDDYLKAGFKLLPSAKGKTKASAFQIFVYSVAMIPIGILPSIQILPDVPPICNVYAMPILAALGLLFAIPGYYLYKTLEMKYAKQLMFASFIYLPVAQLIYYFFKL